MSWQPAVICGLDTDHSGDQGGPVVPGSVANLCVIDPAAGISCVYDIVSGELVRRIDPGGPPGVRCYAPEITAFRA